MSVNGLQALRHGASVSSDFMALYKSYFIIIYYYYVAAKHIKDQPSRRRERSLRGEYWIIKECAHGQTISTLNGMEVLLMWRMFV